MMGKRWRTAGILSAGILSGAFRDYLFINLNYQIDHLQRATAGSFAHSDFQAFVLGWDLMDLLRMKWALAAAFVLLMWGLCLLLLRNANAFDRLARPVTLIFCIVAITALLAHGLARWLPVEEASTNLLHAIQYPVLLIVLQVVLVVFPTAPGADR